jgi:cyclase
VSVPLSQIGLRTTALRDNVRVFTLGGESIETSYGANCTAVAGRERVLLVDPLIAPAYARHIEAAVGSWTPLPIRFVLVTHHHTDHALGAGYFADSGATVIAHAACRDRMAAEHQALIESRRRQPHLADLFADAEAYRPAIVFEKDLAFDLGGTQVRVLHPGPGHTSGDAFLYLPAESAAICGDLVSSGYHVNYEDASVENLARGLELLHALDVRTYVPGHGPLGGPELLAAQARYHSTVRSAVERISEEAELIAFLRTAFPGFLLGEVLSSSSTAWKGASAEP